MTVRAPSTAAARSRAAPQRQSARGRRTSALTARWSASTGERRGATVPRLPWMHGNGRARQGEETLVSWSKSTTTKHTCGGPVFGKKTPDCPRCDELLAGAEPVRWAMTRQQDDAQRAAEIRAHDCTVSRCAVVCTFGQW